MLLGNWRIVVNQMFVQFQEPVVKISPYPIVIFHGTFQNGSNFLGTPDGRAGWADYFLKSGYSVYVVDTPASGRSSYKALIQGQVKEVDADFLQEYFTKTEVYN